MILWLARNAQSHPMRQVKNVKPITADLNLVSLPGCLTLYLVFQRSSVSLLHCHQILTDSGTTLHFLASGERGYIIRVLLRSIHRQTLFVVLFFFLTTASWHSSVPWDNVKCPVKNDKFHLIIRINNIPLSQDCAFKGMWAYFPPSISYRISALSASKWVSHWVSIDKWRD